MQRENARATRGYKNGEKNAVANLEHVLILDLSKGLFCVVLSTPYTSRRVAS